MSIPIAQACSDVSYSSIECLDFSLCQIIVKGHSSFLDSYLNSGLSPNYVLQEDIVIQNNSFDRGTSLLSIICQCCTFSNHYWNYIIMINSLLMKDVDLENSPGGGYASVLDYICANESYIWEDVIVTILKKVSQERVQIALSLIPNISRRIELFREITGSQFTIFNSNEVNQVLFQGDEAKLKELLNVGLHPDYLLEQDLLLEDGGVIEKGSSMLLAVLMLIIFYKGNEIVLWKFFEILALLLERGSSLEVCLREHSILEFVCKNEHNLPRDIVLCLLGSVSLEKAILTLSYIENPDIRKDLEKDLRSNVTLFRSEKYGIENVFRDILQSVTVSNEPYRPYVKTKYEVDDDGD